MIGFGSRARRNPSFMLGAMLSVLFAGAALLSLVWTPWPAAAIDIPNKLAAPSAAHWLGTDSLGRDIASQLLVGARTSIMVGVVAVLIGLVLGVGLGSLARGDSALGGAHTGIMIWSFIVMPVSLTALVFSEKRFGAWLIDALYQFVYFAAMGAILSRWG